MSLPERTEKSVIIIEPENERAQVLSSYLALYGLRISVFSSLGEAVAATANATPDVIIADLDVVSGENLTSQFGGKPSAQRILYIALGEAAVSERAAMAGFDLFLPKPTDFEMLAEIIQNYDGG